MDLIAATVVQIQFWKLFCCLLLWLLMLRISCCSKLVVNLIGLLFPGSWLYKNYVNILSFSFNRPHRHTTVLSMMPICKCSGQSQCQTPVKILGMPPGKQLHSTIISKQIYLQLWSKYKCKTLIEMVPDFPSNHWQHTTVLPCPQLATTTSPWAHTTRWYIWQIFLMTSYVTCRMLCLYIVWEWSCHLRNLLLGKEDLQWMILICF